MVNLSPNQPKPLRCHRSTVSGLMSVDVEDYFHVSAFEDHIRREDWDPFRPVPKLGPFEIDHKSAA